MQIFCTAGGPAPQSAFLVHDATGVVSINYENTVKSVCGSLFDDTTVETVCNELYGSPEFISYEVGHECAQEEFWLGEVRCDALETSLSLCPHSEWGLSTCDPTTDCVRVYCSAGGPQPENKGFVVQSQQGILGYNYNNELRAVTDP